MTHYLLELYAAQGTDREARRLKTAIAASGDGFRYLGTILVPADETCFCLVRAASSAALAELARETGVEPERIAEAVVDEALTARL